MQSLYSLPTYSLDVITIPHLQTFLMHLAYLLLQKYVKNYKRVEEKSYGILLIVLQRIYYEVILEMYTYTKAKYPLSKQTANCSKL